VAEQQSVGRVLGTQHTSTQEFRVVLDDENYLQLDDLVLVRTEVPKAGEVRTYGVVTESEGIYEGASFESDTFRIAEEGILPAEKVRSAQVAVTRVDPELWSTAPRALSGTKHCMSTRWVARFRSGSAEMSNRCTPTSTSSTVARAATCRFRAFPA